MKEMVLNNETQGETKPKRAATILEQYERFKNVPPNIIYKNPLSLSEIAQKEGCEISSLESDIKTKVEEFAEKMKKECGSPSEQYVNLIDSLYNLYLQSKNPELVKEYPWLSSLNSYEEFANHFCPQATPNAHSFIKKNLRCFVEMIVNQEKSLEISPRSWYGVNKDGIREIYSADNNWMLLPSEYYNSGAFDYADREVISEIKELLKSGYRRSAFTHSSGSAALPGIAKSGSILSAQDVEREGIKIATGEHISYVSSESGIPVAGGKYGLGSVYASKDGPTYGYHHLNWFDEYHVAFGINKEKQEEFLRQIDFKYEWASSEDNPARTLDLGSEGIEIGNRVPLSNVEIVYFWKRHQTEMELWVKENCPQAKLISLEAANVLKDNDHKINKIALQEGISVEEAWGKIL